MGNTGFTKHTSRATKTLHRATHGFTKRLRQETAQIILVRWEIGPKIDYDYGETGAQYALR